MLVSAAALTTLLLSPLAQARQVDLEARSDAATGKVTPFLFPECFRGSGGTRKKTSELPADHMCTTTHGLSLRIDKPAVCSNGTMARIALFEDQKCNHGEVTSSEGWLDFNNDITDSCVEIGPQFRSMMFYCDGPTPKNTDGDDGNDEDDEDEEPAKPTGPKKGSTSDSTCHVPGQPHKMPLFTPSWPDKCVNVKPNKRLQVFHSALCADGSTSTFARYSGYGCMGSPEETRVIEEKSDCMSMSDGDKEPASYTFLCDGVEEAPPSKGNNGGGVLGLVLILVLILAISILSCATACMRWATFFNKMANISKFFKRDGAIALE